MNAAIVYNEGEIIVNTVIDISEVLEKYRFDGKKYVNIETNKKVNIKNLKIIQNHSHIRLDFYLKWQEF